MLSSGAIYLGISILRSMLVKRVLGVKLKVNIDTVLPLSLILRFSLRVVET